MSAVRKLFPDEPGNGGSDVLPPIDHYQHALAMTLACLRRIPPERIAPLIRMYLHEAGVTAASIGTLENLAIDFEPLADGLANLGSQPYTMNFTLTTKTGGSTGIPADPS
jgi:hypothetical protein